MTQKLTHFDEHGQAHMVDVGEKAQTARLARAVGTIDLSPVSYELLTQGTSKKGDVLGVARLAGIMASKQTSTLIPLCHPIALTKVSVTFELDADKHRVTCTTTAQTVGQTGVEMEALTATSVALLTIYDMLKAVDRGMIIGNIALERKEGGRSGVWERDAD